MALACDPHLLTWVRDLPLRKYICCSCGQHLYIWGSDLTFISVLDIELKAGDTESKFNSFCEGGHRDINSTPCLEAGVAAVWVEASCPHAWCRLCSLQWLGPMPRSVVSSQNRFPKASWAYAWLTLWTDPLSLWTASILYLIPFFCLNYLELISITE